MKKQIYAIHAKIFFWFLVITLISSVLSFTTINITLSRKIFNELKDNQLHTAQIILALSQNDNLSTNDIINKTSSKVFNITKISDLSKYTLTNEEITQLHNNRYLFKHTGYSNIITLVQIKDDFAVITIDPNANLFMRTLIQTGLTLIFALIISSIIIILFSKRALKPIRSLINATQEVARGNFSIRLKNENKDEIAKLTENFNIMTQELGKIEILREDFVSNVSHEFKTPLSSIQGFATLLKNTDLTNEQKDFVDIIVDESSRLAKLTSNILNLSKLESSNILIDKKSFFLDEQLRHTLLMLGKKIQDKNINLEIDLETIRYYNNDELLEQVWINLIENAIKYSKDNGTIYISCKKNDENIVVSIKDNGIGMNKETKERIYEKFFQGDKAHSSEGNGLGLALVKKVVDIIGGTINVESELNVGSTFIITLPTAN